MAYEDLTGKRFGMLVVEKRLSEKKGRSFQWQCKCDCGNTTIAFTNLLKSGRKRSCGCLKFASKNATHGFSKTRLYHIWQGMKKRCYNKSDGSYADYGGRGITICEEWLNDFVAFRRWALSNGYKDDLTIERDDVNGNYEPSNCKWIPKGEQNYNLRTSRMVTFNGKTKPLTKHCMELGISRGAVQRRVQRGQSYEDAIFSIVNHVPRKKFHNSGQFNPTLFVTFNGKERTIKELCNEYGKPYNMVYNRIKRGWSVEKALTTPSTRK